ncbi:unnamed protein product [Caretta caretta]
MKSFDAQTRESQIHRFMSVNRLKYFFAVDTAYVTKKLALLLFPYAHQLRDALAAHRIIEYQGWKGPQEVI